MLKSTLLFYTNLSEQKYGDISFRHRYNANENADGYGVKRPSFLKFAETASLRLNRLYVFSKCLVFYLVRNVKDTLAWKIVGHRLRRVYSNSHNRAKVVTCNIFGTLIHAGQEAPGIHVLRLSSYTQRL